MSAPNPIVLSDQDTRVEVSGLVLTETFRPPGLVLPAAFPRAREYCTYAGRIICRDRCYAPLRSESLKRDFPPRWREAFQPIREDRGPLLDH
jgi:hypothetical protein